MPVKIQTGDVTTGQVTETINVPRFVYFFYLVQAVTHTEGRVNELFPKHTLSSLLDGAQRPPLKSRDSQDNPHHCIPRSLVPQRCRISTHTPGVVVRHVEAASELWLVVWSTEWWVDGLRPADSSRAGRQPHMPVCGCICKCVHLSGGLSATVSVWQRFQIRTVFSPSSRDPTPNFSLYIQYLKKVNSAQKSTFFPSAVIPWSYTSKLLWWWRFFTWLTEEMDDIRISK